MDQLGYGNSSVHMAAMSMQQQQQQQQPNSHQQHYQNPHNQQVHFQEYTDSYYNPSAYHEPGFPSDQYGYHSTASVPYGTGIESYLDPKYTTNPRAFASRLSYLPFHAAAAAAAYGMYDYSFEPAFIRKRNERERQRVKCVNEGYARLREHLPEEYAEKRLSKVETLRGAIQYIKQLQTLLGFDPEDKSKEQAQCNDTGTENGDPSAEKNENKIDSGNLDKLQKSCANMQLKNSEFSSENDDSSKVSAFDEEQGLLACEFKDQLGQSREINENVQDKVKVESFSPSLEYSNERQNILERKKKNMEDIASKSCFSASFAEKSKICNGQEYPLANTRNCCIYDSKNCLKKFPCSYRNTEKDNSDCRSHFDQDYSRSNSGNNNCMYSNKHPSLAQSNCLSFDIRQGFLNTDIPSPNWPPEIHAINDDVNENDRKIFRKHQQFYHGNGSCMYSARTFHQNGHYHPYAKLEGKTENNDTSKVANDRFSTIFIKVESQTPPPCQRNQEDGSTPYFTYQLRGPNNVYTSKPNAIPMEFTMIRGGQSDGFKSDTSPESCIVGQSP